MSLYFIVGTVPRCDTFSSLATWLSQLSDNSETTMSCHATTERRSKTEDTDRLHNPSCACEIFHLSSVWVEQDLRPVIQDVPLATTMQYGRNSLIKPLDSNRRPHTPPPKWAA